MEKEETRCVDSMARHCQPNYSETPAINSLFMGILKYRGGGKGEGGRYFKKALNINIRIER